LISSGLEIEAGGGETLAGGLLGILILHRRHRARSFDLDDQFQACREQGRQQRMPAMASRPAVGEPV
jgi:hypothetical protein